MTSIKHETLKKSLVAFNLAELPKALSPNSSIIWITAIVRVRKMTGVESYCIGLNDGDGNVNVICDYYPNMVTCHVISIHPVNVMDKKLTPDLRSDKQIVNFLKANGYDSDKITDMLDRNKYDSNEAYKEGRAKVKSFVMKEAIIVAKKLLEEDNKWRIINTK